MDMDTEPGFVVTAWRNLQELLQLRQDLYNTSDKFCRQKAVNKVFAWRLRKPEGLPLLLDSTADIVDVVLQDERSGLGHNALRLLYATAISRFVTGLADTQIELTRDRPSWFVPGKALQLPLALLETRHRIVHRHLPSLAELKRAAAESLEWLWEWYWSQLETAFSGANGEGEAVEYEEIGVETTQVFKEKLQGLLKSYLKDRKAEIKSKTVGHDGFNAVSKAVSSYTTLCSTILNISGSSPPPQIKNITLHTLLDPKTILPTDRKLGSSMSGAFLIWTPLLLAFCSSPDPTTTPATIPLPTLLAHMLEAMDAPSSRSPENDPVKEAWHDWVLHVLTSREWETARKAVGVVEEVLGNLGEAVLKGDEGEGGEKIYGPVKVVGMWKGRPLGWVPEGWEDDE
ncbi:cell morphogenesis protein las1 [Pyrenophora tritici-repentis]|nr:cell morphogenesis protein las1 [Pyrenophora tritici-repentis]